MKNKCYAKRLGINAIIISYDYKKIDQKILIFWTVVRALSLIKAVKCFNF